VQQYYRPPTNPRTCGNFSKTIGNFFNQIQIQQSPWTTNNNSLLCIPIYARLRIFIQLSATLTKLCHIKRNHPVHIMCAKCPPSAETHTDIFWHFSQTVTNFWPNFTSLLNIHMYARMQIFIQLSPMTKLCHIKCNHQACVLVDGGHFENNMVVALNMASTKFEVIE